MAIKIVTMHIMKLLLKFLSLHWSSWDGCAGWLFCPFCFDRLALFSFLNTLCPPPPSPSPFFDESRLWVAEYAVKWKFQHEMACRFKRQTPLCFLAFLRSPAVVLPRDIPSNTFSDFGGPFKSLVFGKNWNTWRVAQASSWHNGETHLWPTGAGATLGIWACQYSLLVTGALGTGLPSHLSLDRTKEVGPVLVHLFINYLKTWSTYIGHFYVIST